MIGIIMLYALPIAVFLVIIRVGGGGLQARISRAIEWRHRETEQVLDTRLPPSTWVRTSHRVFGWLDRIGAGRLRDLWASLAHRRVLRRLLRLLRYFERTSLVSDEHSRAAITDKIGAIGREWEAMSWTEIAAPAAADPYWRE